MRILEIVFTAWKNFTSTDWGHSGFTHQQPQLAVVFSPLTDDTFTLSVFNTKAALPLRKGSWDHLWVESSALPWVSAVSGVWSPHRYPTTRTSLMPSQRQESQKCWQPSLFLLSNSCLPSTENMSFMAMWWFKAESQIADVYLATPTPLVQYSCLPPGQ